jgi:hypothetical protein
MIAAGVFLILEFGFWGLIAGMIPGSIAVIRKFLLSPLHILEGI